MGKSFTVCVKTLLCVAAVALSGNAWAGTWDIGGGLSATYKLNLGYALAWRAKNPSNSLINGPVDPLQPDVMPQSGTTQQLVGFSHTGLSNTINIDDGNRNFRKYDLIHNRATAFGELSFAWENYGAVFSGSAFYDDVYYGHNSNDSPSTVNKTGPNDRFTDAARYYLGKRARLLEAYVYGDWSLFDSSVYVDLRVGQQLVAWGQSLFLSGVASTMGPADATKAFVPGAQIKDILLPVNQIGLRVNIGPKLTLLGDYKLDYRSTEVFPSGAYFSPADLIGPGGTFTYGSINPAALNGCPGLLGPLSQLCNLGGLGGPLLNAPPNILVTRGPDITPSKKNQWGVGLEYQLFSTLTLGYYHLNYHDTNPTVHLNVGYAFIGSVLGVPITTSIVNQNVPVTYQVQYFDNIKLDSISWSTVLWVFNVAGEFNYRRGVPTPVQTIISGVRSPIYVRSDQGQALVSALYTFNPGFLVDTFTFVGEAGIVHVFDNDKVSASPGVNPVGDGGELYFDETSYGFQTRLQTQNRNIIPGWDLNGLLSYGMIIKGNPPMAGSFGALFGEGIKVLNIGAGMQYLQNFSVDVGYTFYFGDPDKIIGGDANGPVRQNPYADRDYFTLNFSYNL